MDIDKHLHELGAAVDAALEALETAAVSYVDAAAKAHADAVRGTDGGRQRMLREDPRYANGAQHVRFALGGRPALARIVRVPLNAPTPVAARFAA